MTTNQAAVANAGRDDEQAIRELVDTWLAASKAGDNKTLLSLLADDVLFLTPGREPFGKEEFAQHDDSMESMTMDAAIDIKEIKVIADWAWMRSFLKVTFTPAGRNPTKHSGHILTILHKNGDGKWVIARDANFVMPETS